MFTRRKDLPFEQHTERFLTRPKWIKFYGVSVWLIQWTEVDLVAIESHWNANRIKLSVINSLVTEWIESWNYYAIAWIPAKLKWMLIHRIIICGDKYLLNRTLKMQWKWVARSIGKYELEIVIASSIVQFPLGWPDLGLQLGSAAISQSINHTPRWPAWIIIISASGCWSKYGHNFVTHLTQAMLMIYHL